MFDFAIGFGSGSRNDSTIDFGSVGELFLVFAEFISMSLILLVGFVGV